LKVRGISDTRGGGKNSFFQNLPSTRRRKGGRGGRLPHPNLVLGEEKAALCHALKKGGRVRGREGGSSLPAILVGGRRLRGRGRGGVSIIIIKKKEGKWGRRKELS